MSGGIVQNPTFNPALAVIVSITKAQNAVIQTQSPHTFLEGESVRLIVPKEYGMTQINNIIATITFVSDALPSLFRVNVDSIAFDTFSVPANPMQCAQAVPVGEDALQLTGAFRNVLPYT